MPCPLHSACFGLATSRPQFSAARRLTAAQGIVLSLAAAALAVVLAVWPGIIPVVIPMLASPAFLALATLRWACLLRWPQPAGRRPRRLSDAELPVYTVLAPLHREAAILGQLVASLAALRYPRHKLDIKLVVEAEDRETRIALARCRLPPGTRCRRGAAGVAADQARRHHDDVGSGRQPAPRQSDPGLAVLGLDHELDVQLVPGIAQGGKARDQLAENGGLAVKRRQHGIDRQLRIAEPARPPACRLGQRSRHAQRRVASARKAGEESMEWSRERSLATPPAPRRVPRRRG